LVSMRKGQLGSWPSRESLLVRRLLVIGFVLGCLQQLSLLLIIEVILLSVLRWVVAHLDYLAALFREGHAELCLGALPVVSGVHEAVSAIAEPVLADGRQSVFLVVALADEVALGELFHWRRRFVPADTDRLLHPRDIAWGGLRERFSGWRCSGGNWAGGVTRLEGLDQIILDHRAAGAGAGDIQTARVGFGLQFILAVGFVVAAEFLGCHIG